MNKMQNELDAYPLDSEIRINADGSLFLPIEVVKMKLDKIFPSWNTVNFQHCYFRRVNNAEIVSGSIELLVQTDDVKRFIVGAATFDLKDYGQNAHYAATLKSLCISNAAKELGVCFGSLLNDNPVAMAAVKPKMDIVILKKYEKAIRENDKAITDQIESQYNVFGNA